MTPRPFLVHLSDGDLQDLRQRIATTRPAPDWHNEDWSYGVPTSYLASLLEYWLEEYNWRGVEATMNSWPQYEATIQGVRVHYLHAEGRGANPLPIVLTHGWPWTFWDYAKVLGPLVDPGAHGGDPSDSFSVVVPSLPGFVFSAPYRHPGNPLVRVADLWSELMRDVLGYPKFIVQGGDWGAYIAQQVAHSNPTRVLGVHLTNAIFLGLEPHRPTEEDYGPDEAEVFASLQRSLRDKVSHRWVNATEPQTHAHAMNDSPAGLLAVMVDKRNRWSAGDHVERSFSRDDLITTAILYWMTKSYGSAARYYADRQRFPWTPISPAPPYVTAPTHVCVFPEDVIVHSRSIAEELTNLASWTPMPRGGHFAPAEEPELVVDNIRQSFRHLRFGRA